MKKYLLIIIIFIFNTSLAQSNLVQGEYWIDADPGFGLATPISFTSGQNINLNLNIQANASEGFHYVGIRTKDDSARWSQTNITPFYFADSSHPMISRIEYFWNIDTGYNQVSDTVLTNPTNNILGGQLNVPITRPLFSKDTLYVRTQDNYGKWSMTNRIDSTFFVAGVLRVEELLDQVGIKLYPNPIQKSFQISTILNVPIKLTIFDINYKFLIEKNVQNNELINIEMLAAGTYFVLIEMDKKLYRTKIVKS